MCIKSALGKLTLGVSVEAFVESAVAAGVRLLQIRPAHLYRLEGLPTHHRDPFDRLLVCQALVEDLPVIGGDEVFARYGVRVVW